MHELALSQGIIDVIRDQAAAQGFTRVKTVRLVIGALSHVEPEAIAFGFDAVSRGTIAEGAVLDIERPPGQAFCLSCEKPVPLPERSDPCPDCGGHQLVVTGGEEMRVKELEVE
ncbi:hydrogenase maturation nickel metallochaperone HypA [Roseomonas genomospecies 6]|uniref:Hydrogenase maturation factor HypA n=1 Tax=Roseomonas genomospecies 6 TaxID=214106 RepID=A0A9W7NNW4_9PROT|nr:hydrogenase maturation nickel metallochaperone HypA [Roseomonas genomospecies 6]KAA0684182.1 hydrogenase maturation nickel metallochaperone HypA [Roseomonas genomospecies 6]